MKRLILSAIFALICVSAHAQGITRVCTPVYNAGTGALSCPEVGQTGPGNGNNALPVTSSSSADPNNAIAPLVSGSGVSSLILKASPGNLYGVYANCTAACWLMIFNSTTVPSDGSTTAGTASGNLQDCIPIASAGSNSISYSPGPPESFSIGITAVISSTACTTKTAATTGFIHGSVR